MNVIPTSTQMENNNVLHLQLQVQGLTPEIALNQEEQFGTALDKYAENTDRLSQKLFKWGTYLLDYAENHDYQLSEESSELFRRKFEQILRDPITLKLLQHPVLMRTDEGLIVCERSFFERYNMLHSRFYEEEIQGVPHLFAENILGLLRSSKPPVQEIQIEEVTSNKQMMQELKEIEKAISLISVEREQKKCKKQLAIINHALKIKVQEQGEKLEEEVREFEKFAKNHTEEIRSEMGRLKEEQKKTEDLLESQIGVLKEEVKEIQKTSEKLKEELSKEKQQNASNVWHISQLQGQLNNMSNSGGSGCTIL